MTQVTTLGIDIGKTVLHLVGLNAVGQVVLRRKVSRGQLLGFLANLQPFLVGMEACGSAHHLARRLRAHGHDARIIPAQYVRPFVKTNKNDTVDAEAIAEAVLRPTMRFVPIKGEEQQDLQAMHRYRQRLIGRRTALVNQIRGMLYERGLTAPQTTGALAKRLAEFLAVDGDADVTALLRELLQDLREEWLWLDQRIAAIDDKLRQLCRQSDMTCRLTAVPGIGVITATALVAAISDGSGFSRGRDLSAWMGLVPSQHSTGGKARLGGISKRGNSYLRMLFVHCARALLRVLDRERSRLGQWAASLEQRTHRNVVIVALANKLARVAWAVLRPGASFDRTLMAV